MAKVIESSANALSIAQQQKSSSTQSTTSVASISVQPLTMTTLTATTTVTAASSSSNSNLPQATTTTKKSRPKTSSPTRHGPQQCQVSDRATLIRKKKAIENNCVAINSTHKLSSQYLEHKRTDADKDTDEKLVTGYNFSLLVVVVIACLSP